MLQFLRVEGHLSWDVNWLILFGCVAIMYGLFITMIKKEKIATIQLFLFFLSLFLLYMMTGSPFYTMSHLTFSFHMIYMSILFFIIPPLMLLGLPHELTGLLERVKIPFISPFISLILFALLFLMYHLPFILAFLSGTILHNLYVLVLFYLSFFMWWPLARVQEKQFERKKRYAFISSIVITPACLLFILYAVIEEMNNPLISQLSLSLCLPSHFAATDLLPFSYDAQIDQLLAGSVMLAIHKASVVMTLRLGHRIEKKVKR